MMFCTLCQSTVKTPHHCGTVAYPQDLREGGHYYAEIKAGHRIGRPNSLDFEGRRSMVLKEV